MKTFLLGLMVFISFQGIAQKKGDFETVTYFNIAYVSPDRTHVNLYNPEKVKVNLIATELELGAKWSIRSLKLTKIARLGVMADFFNLGCNYFSFTETGAKVKSKVLTGRWSINVGPTLTIRCFQDAFLDIYAKGRGTVCYDYIITKAIDEDAGLGFRLGYSFGTHFSWKQVMIGAEAVYGTTKDVQYNNFIGNVPDNFIKIKLGMCI